MSSSVTRVLRGVGSSISACSNQLFGSEDVGRRVSIRLTGTPDARNHMRVGEMRAVPGEQNFHFVYRADRSVMRIFVLTCGKSALGENSRGQLARLFGRMQRRERAQDFPALARKLLVTIRCFLDDDVRDEHHMFAT